MWRSGRSLFASVMSLSMMVTLFPWMQHTFTSSKTRTIKYSAASCSEPRDETFFVNGGIWYFGIATAKYLCRYTTISYLTWRVINAKVWNRKSFWNFCMISFTKRWKGRARRSKSVEFWILRISWIARLGSISLELYYMIQYCTFY